ncbi:MAG TPA: rod shape-determining protein [Bacillota bacterium]|nr:hypothetical protein [Clostridiales bacterium]HPT84486.1 rod shape-determining protein [Bacillota bacterium]
MKRDIGIDVGTKNTYIYAVAHENVSCEPSAAAVEAASGAAIALGAEARRICMRTPGGSRLIYPLASADADSRVDFEARLLGYHTARLRKGIFRRPRVAVAVRPDISDAEEETLTSAVLEAGALEAVLVDAPIAAAAGAGRDVYSKNPTVVVDAGASKTYAAIVAEGAVKYYIETQTAGDHIDFAISDYIRNKYRIVVAPDVAENLKKMYVTLEPGHLEKQAEIVGTSALSGLPVKVTVRASELSMAALVPAMAISNLVCDVFEKVAADYGDPAAASPTVIVGGTAMLAGFAKFIASETGVRAVVADNPQACTAVGLAMGLG